MSVDWLDLALKVILFALPLILSYVFGKLGVTKEKYQKWQWAVDRAFEFVFAAKDKFPDNSGVQKLAWATEQLKQALIKAGYHITDAEAEALVRSAYQQMRAEIVKGS
jgi:hypothetical protein